MRGVLSELTWNRDCLLSVRTAAASTVLDERTRHQDLSCGLAGPLASHARRQQTLPPSHSDEEEEEHTLLALGVGGSTLQALLDEIRALKLPVAVRAVSSVVPHEIPGDDSATAMIAAESTWGTRCLSNLESLEWLSSEYQPSSRGRVPRRRLIIGQFKSNRPFTPGSQPTIQVSGHIGCQIGALIE